MQTKKNDLGVSPVIAVILMVAITVVLAGVVFLWAQSFTNESGGKVEQLNIRGDVVNTAGANNGNVIFDVIGGSVDWAKYSVKINGTEITAPTGVSNAGDSATIIVAHPADGGVTISTGTSYNIKIINIKDNKVVWEDDIRATNA